MARKRISPKLAAEIIYQADRKCCICGEIGNQIHHLDEDHSNNNSDNLVFLCLEDHNNASTKSFMSRGLSPELIRKYRDDHHKNVTQKRLAIKEKFNVSISNSTNEDILTTTIMATLLIELEEIRLSFYSLKWNKRYDLFDRLDKFSKFVNFRLSSEIFNFFSEITSFARSDMPAKISSILLHGTIKFCPTRRNLESEDTEKAITIYKQIAEIGFNLVYDSFIYSNKISLVRNGLMILKNVNSFALKHDIKELRNLIIKNLDELRNYLKRSELENKENFEVLLNVFEEDMKTDLGFKFPVIPAELHQLVRIEEE